ncbi:hypothetical protein [Roseateles asaccharophilus]|uniref:Carboxypeptidase regulatory-like domain-containing protein n=1 Tax=Roseateles asaccharophilus TaxID=582607 RepID=A0ABU2AHI1_9BURK|nr:hypothetical protein [Roseateles asaccharophilus]MDR7335907.1 hypothetical protein [Roseateles asaccharophilus]
MLSTRVFALLAALSCGACAPMPHVATTLPAISGSLTDAGAGAPVADRQVWVAQGSTTAPCSQPLVTTTTDQQGKFQLARQTEFRLIYAPYFRSIRTINLCAASADKSMLLFSGGFIHAQPAAATFSCQLREFQRGQTFTAAPCVVVSTTQD